MKLPNIKGPGKLSVRRTLKILPGVRLSGSLNGLSLLIGAMGVTYTVPLIKKVRKQTPLPATAAPATHARTPRTTKSAARADRNNDRVFNTRDSFVVTGRKAARELCTQLDETIVIINVVDDTFVEYWSGKTFHKVRTEILSFWLDNNELERLEENHDPSQR